MSRDDHNLNDDENYSNAWHDFQVKHPQVFAEFHGTFILVLWGLGVTHTAFDVLADLGRSSQTQAQVIAARKATDDYISISWGWGVVLMLAIYVSSDISGGHINSFLTVSLAVFRKFPWKQVPGYIGAQMSGGFLAAGVIYGVYYGPLHAMTDGNYSGIFITGPGALRPSIASNVFNVFVPAALLIAPFRLSRTPETTPRRRVSRLSSWVSSWLESLRALATRRSGNAARDFGPRIQVWMTKCLGAGGRVLWLSASGYGIWIPTVSTTCGALFGNFLYDLLVYNGRDSPLNRNYIDSSFFSFFKSSSTPSLSTDKDSGAYFSGAISCSTSAFNAIPLNYPTSQEEFDVVQEASAASSASCRNLASPGAPVDHLSTPNVARDFESLRTALALNKVHFLGVSYGTFYGAQWAADFPHALERVVLDAVFGHGLINQQLFGYSVKSANRMLERADAYCQFSSSCPFQSQGNGSAISAYTQVLANASAAPLPPPSASTRPYAPPP